MRGSVATDDVALKGLTDFKKEELSSTVSFLYDCYNITLSFMNRFFCWKGIPPHRSHFNKNSILGFRDTPGKYLKSNMKGIVI